MNNIFLCWDTEEDRKKQKRKRESIITNMAEAILTKLKFQTEVIEGTKKCLYMGTQK